MVVNRQPPPIGDPSHVDVHLSNPDVLLPHSVADFRHLDDFRRLTVVALDVLVLLQYQEANRSLCHILLFQKSRVMMWQHFCWPCPVSNHGFGHSYSKNQSQSCQVATEWYGH